MPTTSAAWAGNAIVKKLIRLGVPTKFGCKWSESVINNILSNEKYIGDTCLQKGYVADHITKKLKPNRGVLPMYYVEGTHEAIINKDTFDAVQVEHERRAAQYQPHKRKTLSEFTGLISCGKCGANFCRKIYASSTKYQKVIWSCTTFTNRGKDQCGAKRISEDILKAKCAEVLRLTEYNVNKFKAKVDAINVPDDGVLLFTLKDGSQRTVTWENPSRRDSWTDEMKAAAMERQKEVHCSAKC